MAITFNYEGKVVLITGSSSGIGAATAIQFAKAGANVVVTGRNADRVKAVAKQCREVSPKKANPLEVLADITKREDLRRLVETTTKTFGRLDILVNNAGFGVLASVTDPEYMDKFQNALDINLNSVVYLTHLSVEHLEKTKGNIINISSVAAIRPNTLFPAYSVAKAGLDMFTQCMAAELGPKRIRVNAINPGAVVSSFHTTMGVPQTAIDASLDKYGPKLPTGRVGTPDDIAYAILFLASEESSYITGSRLVSDGGHCAASTHFE